MTKNPKVELSIPIIPDMELAATQTSEVVAKHMGLTQDQSDEIKVPQNKDFLDLISKLTVPEDLNNLIQSNIKNKFFRF